MADSTPAAGDFDKNNAEGTNEMKTKNGSADDMSGNLLDAVCPGYVDEAKFSLTFSLDSVNEKPKSEKVLVGNHLKWYLCAKQGSNKGEKFLTAYIFNEYWCRYPISCELEFTLEANHPNNRIVQKGSLEYGEPIYQICGAWMIAYDKLLNERDKFEVDGKLTMTAKLNIRMPTFYNFNGANSLSDVTIKIGQRSFPINKTILAVHSNYFRAMFFGQFDESKQDEVILNDVDPVAFVMIINMLFVRSFKLKMSSVASVLKLADRFGMFSILDQCEEMLLDLATNMKPSVGERLVLATKYSLNKLQKRYLDFFDSAYPSR